MLIFIDLVGPRIGGAITVGRNLLANFAKLRPEWRFRVFVLPEAIEALQAPQSSNLEFVPIPGARNGLGRVFWQQWRLPRLALKNRADVIFSLVNIGPRYSRVPTVVYYHQALHFFHENDGPKKVSRQYFWEYFRKRSVLAGFRGATKIITQTKVMKKAIVEQTGISKSRVICVPAGRPNTDSISSESKKEMKIIQEKLLSLDHPIAIYLSYPSEHKNFSAIFRAAAKMKEYSILGSFALTLDPKQNSDWRYFSFIEKYRSEIKHLGVGDRISFIGNVPAAGVNKLLSSCDALVFPSLIESFPQPLTEAMEVGLLMLLADRPYAREIGGKAALYFNPLDDGSSLAELMKILACDAKKISEMKKASAYRARLFSYEKAARQILNIFCHVSKGLS